MVSGANHGKPLPRVPTPAVDIVRDIIALSALVLMAVLLAPGLSTVVRSCDDPRPGRCCSHAPACVAGHPRAPDGSRPSRRALPPPVHLDRVRPACRPGVPSRDRA